MNERRPRTVRKGQIGNQGNKLFLPLPRIKVKEHCFKHATSVKVFHSTYTIRGTLATADEHFSAHWTVLDGSFISPHFAARLEGTNFGSYNH